MVFGYCVFLVGFDVNIVTVDLFLRYVSSILIYYTCVHIDYMELNKR